MDSIYIEMLIQDYDQLHPLPRSVYREVIPYLTLVKQKRGTILKKSGQVDRVSRYLLKGFIGYYGQFEGGPSLLTIFKPSDTAFDLESYGHETPSDKELKAISDIVFFEFSIESQKVLLSKDIRLIQLAHSISMRVLERHGRSLEIAKMRIRDGYSVLMKEYPGLEAELTNADLGGFFRVTKRTAEREKQRLKFGNHGKV